MSRQFTHRLVNSHPRESLPTPGDSNPKSNKSRNGLATSLSLYATMFRLLLLLLGYQMIVQAAHAASILPRDETSCNCVDGCSQRTLFNIAWGCVSTTIICAWAAIHPNIPPRERPFKATIRRLELIEQSWHQRSFLLGLLINDWRQ